MAGTSWAQKCNVDSGFRGSSFSINRYEQRHLLKGIPNLKALPKDIQLNLQTYLNKKLSISFAKRLKFGGGEYLDLNKLKLEFPDVYRKTHKYGAYDLTFYFSDKNKGLKSYYIKLALNEDGSINEEIGLPDIALFPEKGKIISCSQASAIAEKQGFPLKHQSIRFEYSSESQSFIWIVTDNRPVKADEILSDEISEDRERLLLLAAIGNGKGTYKTIDINANNGSVIRIYKYTIAI